MLNSLRILAIEQYGAGPFGTQFLADMGAEVIKVENRSQGGDVGRTVGPAWLDDGDASARSAKHVGNAIRNAVGIRHLAGNGQAAGAGGIGPPPRAAGIDHRTSLDHLARGQVQLERLPVAALGPHLVEVLAANRRHARVQPDVRCNRGMVAKRRHVLLNEIVAGRQRVIGGCLPALAV